MVDTIKKKLPLGSSIETKRIQKFDYIPNTNSLGNKFSDQITEFPIPKFSGE